MPMLLKDPASKLAAVLERSNRKIALRGCEPNHHVRSHLVPVTAPNKPLPER